ncbi:HAD family hydrolase [Vibrio parahaemolyticus]|uniref:HAD family hydrolase n=1 Tax=Vibrio parahaemolyticus TaxID=670 RepID=UPI00111E8C76|nr:HAD family phosphatase [Vibrio parahaemolyticus]EKQ5899866.1 HAD family phosphatase [Vibrio parahaemolyticus]ELA8134721.1 HAD family phosphatase [Vibrio parahaemolyticus]MCD1414977.1 HAD family phosphatase [Vibrio parahaemolyticus]MDF4473085.1 HAD family phosphatase [Vibrio parahaemolyticus]MDF4477465.1 HAD family phosphatase [Vibrio parahaemolyticus]
MLKAILFDMDGLIFDTESIYRQSWQFAGAEQGLQITDDTYQQFIGVQDPECERILAEHFQNAIDMTRYRAVRDAHFHQLREQGIGLKTGFDGLFSAIKLRGLTTALVTSSHRPDVLYNFAPFNYLDQFDLIITAEDVQHGKPHPECYQMAYRKLGLKSQQCLVLEDSNNGIKAALAAGCHAVMIPDLLPPQTELMSDITVLDNLAQVIPLLDSYEPKAN